MENGALAIGPSCLTRATTFWCVTDLDAKRRADEEAKRQEEAKAEQERIATVKARADAKCR